MEAKVLMVGLMITVGALIGTQHPHEIAAQRENPAQVYESCIVKKIEKCESLAELLYTSNSVTLRRYADLQIEKAHFFDLQREMLINTMIQRQLEPKRYKIEHFLEEQFHRHLGK